MNERMDLPVTSLQQIKDGRVAIGWADDAMMDAFSKSGSIINYGEQGWIFKNKEENLLDTGERSEVSVSQIDPTEILKKLQRWYPVIYRWTNLGINIEHQISETILAISRLISEIKELNIKTFIFHTGVPHHYDSMILSIACELSEVSQVFLYANVFDGSLIPIYQDGSLINRSVLLWKGGRKKYSETVDEFISRRLNNKTPPTSDAHGFLLNWWKYNIVIALSYLGYKFFRSGAASVSQIITGAKDNTFLRLKDYSIIEHLKIILAQREFVSLYNKKCINYQINDNFFSEQGSVKLVIAAHYQPEATSFPEGWDFYTHTNIVLKIRSLGYVEKLYYKEHYGSKFYIERYVGLTRVGLCRNKQYLERLIGMGCVLISPEVPLPMKGNFVPVTITGTIAIERALLGLRTIVFGHPWYLGLPGVLQIEAIESLFEIPKEWTIPNPEIAKRAKQFILDYLDNNTLTNIAGIGVGRRIDDNESQEIYKKECLSLLELFQ